MSRSERLLTAVAVWEAAPPDPARDAFMGKVAENAKAIAERDETLGPGSRDAARARMAVLVGREGEHDALLAALAGAIRSGALAYDDPALLDHLRLTALDELAIEQPRYRHGLVQPG